jgi:hypothetical protein
MDAAATDASWDSFGRLGTCFRAARRRRELREPVGGSGPLRRVPGELLSRRFAHAPELGWIGSFRTRKPWTAELARAGPSPALAHFPLCPPSRIVGASGVGLAARGEGETQSVERRTMYIGIGTLLAVILIIVLLVLIF